MEFFKHNTRIDFMGKKSYAAVFSILLFVGSVWALVANGLHWGLDFTGGMQIAISYQQPANITQIRQALDKQGLNHAEVKSYGTATDVLISVGLPKGAANKELVDGTLQQKVSAQIKTALPDAKLQRIDFVGPQLGRELANKGALALVVAMLGTMIYILLRFEYRFAVSSTVALIHDPFLILGIFALFHVEFDVNALGALLAVIGYSLNDTIVVFDRVRENFKKMRKATPTEVVNAAVNQTLSRTIMTSGLTLTVVVVLYFFGGEMIHSFSLAMIIGIVIGTYSSIYVAGALALAMGLNRNDLLPAAKAELDTRP